MSELTVERVRSVSPTRWLYRLSEKTTTKELAPEQFDHIVLSLGRLGDTCVFPANAEGGVLDFVGFGFGMGPSRWLTEAEIDGFVEACVAQHVKDGGEGVAVALSEGLGL